MRSLRTFDAESELLLSGFRAGDRPAKSLVAILDEYAELKMKGLPRLPFPH